MEAEIAFAEQDPVLRQARFGERLAKAFFAQPARAGTSVGEHGQSLAAGVDQVPGDVISGLTVVDGHAEGRFGVDDLTDLDHAHLLGNGINFLIRHCRRKQHQPVHGAVPQHVHQLLFALQIPGRRRNEADIARARGSIAHTASSASSIQAT
ncbi:hypothetical protein D9M72_580020 [compost metagenome]